MGLAHDLLAVHRTYGFRTTTRLVAAEAKRLAVNQTLRRSFSQAYEDRFAWELLDRPTGFYVDIGCHDPVRLSNTYRLYRKGWSGLAVDASPEFAERFARLRPRDRFVNVGVGEGSEPIPFYVHSASALSTFSRSQSERYVEDGHPVVAVLDIPVMTLGGLLAQHVGDRHIDFLSLDIEGLDLVALRTNDWDRYRPDLICTEVSPNAGREAAERPDADVDALLADQGYRLAGLRGANAFYLRSG